MSTASRLNALPYKGVPPENTAAPSTYGVKGLNTLPYGGSSADALGPTSADCRQAIEENGKPFRLLRARPVPAGTPQRRGDGRVLEEVAVDTLALFDGSEITLADSAFGPLQGGRLRMKSMPDEVTISRLDHVVRLDAFQNALWAGAGDAPLVASGTLDDALPIPYPAQIMEAYWFHAGIKVVAAQGDCATTDTGLHWLTTHRPAAGDALFVHYIPYLAGRVVEDEGRATGTGADGNRMWQITLLDLLRGEAT